MGSSARPERLDVLLVRQGLAASRQRARALIEEGVVCVDGVPVTRPASRVRADRRITLSRDDFSWVGRGALKLLGVLQPLGVEAAGKVCADLGASTGGFTQVLIEQGAARVYAIDVGKGQLAWILRNDERVVLMEGVNARYLEALDEPMDLVVGDLSFISLALILPAVRRILRPGGEALLLIKPQFEVGREAIGKGGRVRDEPARIGAIDRVLQSAVEMGLEVVDHMDCPVAGARAGNVEHFVYLMRPDEGANTETNMLQFCRGGTP